MTSTTQPAAPTAARFWDRVAERYAAKPVADQAAYEATLARTAQYLTPTDRVLEIGAGTASTALVLAPRVAAYTASDISGAMVAIGQRKAAAAGIRNLEVVQGELRDADGSYDAILAFNLLHLCSDPAAEIAEAASRLSVGGYFISKTGCLSGRFALLRPVIAMMRLLGKAPRVRFFSAARLEAMIRDAGFEIVETGRFPAGSPAYFIVARKR